MVDKEVEKIFHQVFDDYLAREINDVNHNIKTRYNGREFEINVKLTNHYDRAKTLIRELPKYKKAIDDLQAIDVPAVPVMSRVQADLDKLAEKEIEDKLAYELININMFKGVAYMHIARIPKINKLKTLAEKLTENGVNTVSSDDYYYVMDDNTHRPLFVITERDDQLAFATENSKDPDFYSADPKEIDEYAHKMIVVAQIIKELQD